MQWSGNPAKIVQSLRIRGLPDRRQGYSCHVTFRRHRRVAIASGHGENENAGASDDRAVMIGASKHIASMRE
jgi:hypothetical protein